MDRALEQLKEALMQENNTYKETLQLEQEKVKVIKAVKLRELEEITRLEQQYLMKMSTYEKIRRSIFVAIAEELEVTEIKSLSELLMLIEDQKTIDEIDELRNQLLDTILKLKEVNQSNEKLLQQQLEYINFSIELLTVDPSDGINYGGKAEEKGKRKTNLFDARV
jgi:hypothetical protein